MHCNLVSIAHRTLTCYFIIVVYIYTRQLPLPTDLAMDVINTSKVPFPPSVGRNVFSASSISWSFAVLWVLCSEIYCVLIGRIITVIEMCKCVVWDAS